MSLSQRRRSIGVSSLLWGGAWAVAFTAVESVAVLGTAPSGSATTQLVDVLSRVAASGAAWGLVAGATFGVVFGWMLRGRHVAHLSRGKAALWGAVAGAAVPALELLNALSRAAGPISFRWGAAALVPCLGAISAAAAVHVATRTSRPSPDPDVLPASLRPELSAGLATLSDLTASATERQPARRPPATQR